MKNKVRSKQILEKSNGTNKNLAGPKKCNTCFCVIFDCYDQKIFLGVGGTGHYAVSLPVFEIFLKFPNFLNPKFLFIWKLVRQLVQEVSYTRHKVPVYLLNIKLILKFFSALCSTIFALKKSSIKKALSTKVEGFQMYKNN